MKITYDDKLDIVYIRIDDREQDTTNVRVDADIVLDIGTADKLVGIEIMGASKRVDIGRLMPAAYSRAG